MLHFVVNEEKFFLRYNDGDQEWEITLDKNTIGGKALYEWLKDKKKIELAFQFHYETFKNYMYSNYDKNNFPSLYETNPSSVCHYKGSDMVASGERLEISQFSGNKEGAEKIGYVNGDIIYDLFGEENLYLELIFKSDEIEKPNASKKKMGKIKIK